MAGLNLNKKVTFEAEESGVLSTYDKISRSASNLTRELLQQATSYSSSSKEQNNFLEEQISLIEKRNKLDQQVNRFSAKDSYNNAISSGSSPEEAKEQLTEQLSRLDQIAQEDELQTKLMRDIVDTLKSTARQEIREDKKNVEAEINAEKRSGLRDMSLPVEDRYKRDLQEGFLDSKQESESKSKDRKGVGGVVNMGTKAAMDPMSALSNFSIMGVGVGAALAMVLNSSEKREISRLKAEGSGFKGGRSARGYRFGMTDAEEYDFGAQISRGSGVQIGSNLESLMGLSFSKNIDTSTFASLLASTRGANQNISQKGLIDIVAALYGGGANDANITNKIGQASQINQMLRESNSSFDIGTSTTLLSEFRKIGGSFADDRVMGNISQMNNAFRNPNDLGRGMMMMSMAEADPSMNFFDMQLAMDRGMFSKVGDGNLLSTTLDKQISSFGGIESLKEDKFNQGALRNLLVQQNLGSQSQMNELLNSLLSGDLTTEDLAGIGSQEKLNELIDKGKSSGRMNIKSLNVKKSPAALKASSENVLADLGDSAGGAISTAVDKIIEIFSKYFSNNEEERKKRDAEIGERIKMEGGYYSSMLQKQDEQIEAIKKLNLGKVPNNNSSIPNIDGN